MRFRLDTPLSQGGPRRIRSGGRLRLSLGVLRRMSAFRDSLDPASAFDIVCRVVGVSILTRRVDRPTSRLSTTCTTGKTRDDPPAGPGRRKVLVIVVAALPVVAVCIMLGGRVAAVGRRLGQPGGLAVGFSTAVAAVLELRGS